MFLNYLKTNTMKRLLLLFLLIPIVSFGQQSKSLETLRSSSEECKSVFVDSVNSFYKEVDRLCTEDYNRKMDAFYDSGYKTYDEYLRNTTEEENEEDDEESFIEVLNVPRFLQCFLVDQNDARACFQEQMNAHIMRNFRYPEAAQEQGIQGRVYINFIINECGFIENIRTRSPDKLLDDEAIRIINLIPRLLPGTTDDGSAVKVPFSLPITFKLR
jgi:periplasmic protein TonB